MNKLQKVSYTGDADIENGVFTLAYQQLQSKLPNVLQHLVGFELTDKSDDGTSAKGLFGLRSRNGEVLLVPVFFNNGDIQGIDSFYAKKYDQFYPLNEDFMDMFLKDDVTGIGHTSPDDKQQIMRDQQYQDLRSMSTPPQTGRQVYAEEQWYDPEDVKKLSAPRPEIKTAALTDFLKTASNKSKTRFLDLIEKNADFCESVLRFYGEDELAKALVPHKVASVEPKVEVIKASDVKAASLNDEQKQKLLTDGYYILDKRAEEEKSRHGVFQFAEKFTSPRESGFYNYITESGTIRYGIVLTKLIGLNTGFPSDDALVIDLDASNKGQAYLVKATNILIKDQYNVKDFSEVHKMMDDAVNMKPSWSEKYILINEQLKATVPFRVIENFKDAAHVRRVKVEICSGSSDTPYPYKTRPVLHGNAFEAPNPPRSITLVFTKKNSDKLEYHGEIVYVPKGFKVLEVDTSPSFYEPLTAPDSPEESAKRALKRKQDESDWKEGKPGKLSMLMANLNQHNVFPYGLRTNGSEYFVNIAAAKKKYDSPLEAKIGMVLEVGLGVKEAEELIDSVTEAKPLKGYIKRAYLGDESPEMLDNQPGVNQLGQEEWNPWTSENSISREDGYTGDPTAMGVGDKGEADGQQGGGGSLDSEVRKAIQLAQSGQKQIFDTHSIATLGKYVEPDAKVTEYMPDYVACLDKLGRMLYLIHSDVEKFTEMYGRDELPELVELLTNVFNNLGDLVVFLKRKSPMLSIGNNERDLLNV